MKQYFGNYKKGSVLSILLLTTIFLQAQHTRNITITANDIYYNLDTGYYDVTSKTGIPAVLVKKSIYSKRTHKLEEEFLKMSDTTAVYIRYGEKLNPIEKGMLKSNTDSLLHIEMAEQIPDMTNDPDGSKGLTKDTIVADIPGTIRYGYWVEEEWITDYGKSGSASKKLYMKAGYYKEGERYGDWEFGQPYFQKNGDSEIVIQTAFVGNYDGLQHRKNDPLPAAPRELLGYTGNWYIMKKSSIDSLFLTRNQPTGDQGWNKINFYSTHSYRWEYEDRAPANHSGGDWTIKNDTLIINNQGSRMQYKIKKVQWPRDPKQLAHETSMGNKTSYFPDDLILIKMN
jgi:hypothetical protein